MSRPIAILFALFMVSGCAAGEPTELSTAAGPSDSAPSLEGASVATFAGGCFWCMEPPFDKLEGVLSTTSGYVGGPERNPTYEQVSAGKTGHTEAVQVAYDPEVVSYQRLLEVFWHNIDPTVADRQFCDWGKQYRTGIFVHDSEQRRLAEESLRAIEADPPFEGAIVTEITDVEDFWPAEEYHQDFYEKSPLRYTTYRRGCGRDARLEELWGDQAGH